MLHKISTFIIAFLIFIGLLFISKTCNSAEAEDTNMDAAKQTESQSEPNIIIIHEGWCTPNEEKTGYLNLFTKFGIFQCAKLIPKKDHILFKDSPMR